VSDKKALGRCSWCGKKIKAGAPVYGFGGRKRLGIDLTEYQGSAILISLITVPKEVICMVTTPDSPAKADGKDFMFMVCSETCAEEMKSVMEADAALGNALFGGLERINN
ncbi:MAG: hypothetical protein V2J11_08450, partial [Desulfofustis sp.]|jgi:hypothetical protein|nr:hypothetical protein [Desulfofustis sp.]